MGYIDLEDAGLIRDTREHRDRYEEQEYESYLIKQMEGLIADADRKGFKGQTDPVRRDISGTYEK